MTYILCVDPGVTGAYAVITSKKKIILCKLFTNFETVLEDIEPYLGNLEACIESAHGRPMNSTRSVTTSIMNAGTWNGILIALKIPHMFVSPVTWPKAVFDIQAPKKSSTGLKGKELSAVVRHNRTLKKLHTTSFILRALPEAKQYFKLKKDQDKADALCIGLYYIKKRLSV